MKKLLMSIVALVLALTCCFAVVGCGKDDKVVDVKKGTITVGYTLYEPMNYKDENDVLVGFDTELALMVFGGLGYDVRFKLIEWSNKYNEVNSGTIDCIWNGFTANAKDDGKDRSEYVDFSHYYMANAQCIIRKATATDVTSYDAFEGKSVAYEAGSAGETFIADNITATINKKGVTSQMDAVREVLSGTADYAIVDILLAKSVVGKGDFTALTVNEGIEIEGEYYAIGFKKGSELTAKVNAMLEAYAKTGYLTELAKKYGLENTVITEFGA